MARIQTAGEVRLLAAFPATRERQEAIGAVLGKLPALYNKLNIKPDVDLRVGGGYKVTGWEIDRTKAFSDPHDRLSEVTRRLFVRNVKVPAPAVGLLSRWASLNQPARNWRDSIIDLNKMAAFDAELRNRDGRLLPTALARTCGTATVMLALHDQVEMLVQEYGVAPDEFKPMLPGAVSDALPSAEFFPQASLGKLAA